jgi:pimeloyl-ACP methyl ester carboxylesterase
MKTAMKTATDTLLQPLRSTAVAHEDILPNHLRFTETTHRVASTRGVTISVTDWGSGPDDERPILMMSHATGLHAHCYVPLVREYEATFRCIGLDQRAQGDSTIPTVGGLAWEGVADDVEIAMGALGLFGRSDVYGIGHSQGGYAILEVERRRPGTFQSLFLYEPVIFTIKGEPGMPDRVAKDNQMASLAERRRATFPSWEDAINNYKVKGPFARADDDLLRSYVYWGFTEEADGSITLKCDPLNEAELFRRAITDLFDAASQIQCPTTVAVSEFTDPVFSTFGPLLGQIMPNGNAIHLAGRSHFGMFENIPEMATIMASALLQSAKPSH